MNEEKEDVGVIHDFDFDLAYGSDENNFELTLNKHLCDYNYYVYIEGTEYGGIIDEIRVDTSKNIIVYAGRTWHGILENKILLPDDGFDYLTLSGNANDVLLELIERMDLSFLFTVPEYESDIVIDSYNMPRFVDAYSGIKKMLESYQGKLIVKFVNGFVQLQCVSLVNYSMNEEFDSSQVAFSISKNERPCNHLICLGTGDLKDRHVIHLFTDANGGIQPYATKENPIEDVDYITDTSQQKMFEEDEIAKVYDYANAEATETYVIVSDQPEDWRTSFKDYYELNDDKYEALESWNEEVYSLLPSQPSDWASKYASYFTTDADGEYISVEEICEPKYTVQSSEPSDWDSNYSSYYMKNDDDEFEKVKTVTNATYTMLDAQPSDWAKNYSDYYYYFTDGTISEYKSASGTSIDEYKLQSMCPSDWNDNYTSYYVRNGSAWKKVVGEGEENPKYVKQTSKPSDWKGNYGSYFYYYSDGTKKEYRSVSGISKYRYVLQTNKPSDWESGFSSYYYKNGSKYNNVAGKKKNKYFLQTSKPSDWSTKWKSYYKLSSNKKSYVQLSSASAPTWKKGKYYTKKLVDSAPTWKKSTYYTKTSYSVAPTWKKDKYFTKKDAKAPMWKAKTYYTKFTKTIAPKWEANKYYSCEKADASPEWVSGTYYTKSGLVVPTWEAGKFFAMQLITKIPEWKPNYYFKKAIDHFAELVRGGIEKLEEAQKCNSLSIGFNPDDDRYDIGDIVGASDNITGLSLSQSITKKIVTIDKNQIKISYEVGDE